MDGVGAGHDVAVEATEAAPTAGAGSHPLEVVAVEGHMSVDPSAFWAGDGSVARVAGPSYGVPPTPGAAWSGS